MKVGDIVVNPYVSKEFDGKLNPNYATIYIGNNETIDYNGRKCKWADKIYRTDIKSQREWKVIGHVDLKSYLKQLERHIREAVNEKELIESDGLKRNTNECETRRNSESAWDR